MTFLNNFDTGYGRITTKPHETPTILELRHYAINTLISDYGFNVVIPELPPGEEPEEHPTYDTFLLGSQVGWIFSNNESVTISGGLSSNELQLISEITELVFDHKVICVSAKCDELTIYLYEGKEVSK